MARSYCALVLTLMLNLTVCCQGFRMKSTSVGSQQVAVTARQEETDLAISGLPIVDISNISRSGYKSWYIVKDGRGVQKSMKNRFVSAKPTGIAWSRIGSWNYSRSANKTKPIIKVKLIDSNRTLVKMDFALRFMFGGRIQKWVAYPFLWKKGRFLRKIRVIPTTFCSKTVHGGYSANAWVSEVRVRRNGTKSDPIAEALLKIKIEYGQKRLSHAHWYKSEWQIVVRGSGRYTARKLSSKGPFGKADVRSLMQMESLRSDIEAESAEQLGELEQNDNEKLVEDSAEEQMDLESESSELRLNESEEQMPMLSAAESWEQGADESEEQTEDEPHEHDVTVAGSPSRRRREQDGGRRRESDGRRRSEPTEPRCRNGFMQCDRADDCCSKTCLPVVGLCAAVR